MGQGAETPALFKEVLSVGGRKVEFRGMAGQQLLPRRITHDPPKRGIAVEHLAVQSSTVKSHHARFEEPPVKLMQLRPGIRSQVALIFQMRHHLPRSEERR